MRKRITDASAQFLALDPLVIETTGTTPTRGMPSETRRGVKDTPPPDTVAQLVETRLREARTMEDRQQRIARWSSWADGFLTTGHYVVGGVLATSFAQQQLPGSVAGGLGLVVLVSSIAQQRFRPERTAITAKRIAAQLRRLLRETEDDLSVAAKPPDEVALREAVQRLSRGLTEIELSEVEALSAQSSRSRSTAKIRK